MEINNEKKLKKITEEINRKTEKLVNKSIIQTAIKVGINVNEVAEKYKANIQAYRTETKAKITKEYQKEIDHLKLEIKKENATIKPAIKAPEKKVGKKVERKVRASVKQPIEKKSGRPKNQSELSRIKEMMFGEQLGYKEIASILGKDEDKVKKIVVKIMCESVA